MNVCKIAALAVAGAIGSLSATAANAGVTITFSQVGADVLATATGTLDLAGLVQEPAGQGYTSAYALRSNTPFILFSATQTTAYGGFSGPSNLGTSSTNPFVATTRSGTPFGFNANPLGPLLFVPLDFVSGDTVSSSMTFDGATFASLGIAVGQYNFILPHDTIAVSISNAAPTSPAVPEPASWAMMIAGFGLVGSAARRARKTSTFAA